MRQSTRLIVNTLITYARMALTVGFGLAVTRLALQQLGETDFGLLATLGASGVLLLVLSDALTFSTQRHIAYELGREDHDTLRAIFNTALLIYGAVGLVAAASGLALWPVLRAVLDIPDGRGAASFWVYVLTLASIVITILATPYRGYLTARQSFVCLAFYDLSQALFGFAAVLLLFTIDGDKLISYAWLLLAVRIAAEGGVVLLSVVAFPDCRPRPWLFRRNQIGRIASFAGWSLVALLAWRFRVQGSTILVNSFYGSRITASYGIASQLGGYQNQIGAAVWRAVRPAMATIEAKGGNEGVRNLTLVSSKYLLLLTLFFLIPAEYEMEKILDLWLDEVPPYATVLTRLVLIWTAMNWVSTGHQMAMEAKGTLSRYTVLMSLFDAAVIITQLVALILIARDAEDRPVVGPWLLPAITIAIVASQNVCRAWYVGRILSISVGRWVREVILPCLLVAAVGAAASLIPFLTVREGLWRLLYVVIFFGVAAPPTIWFLAMARWEREHFLRIAGHALNLGLHLARRVLRRAP